MTPVLSAFSGALLHFAWQGLAVFLLLWAALFALRKHGADARYAVSCAALAVLAAAPLITTYSLYHASPSANPTGAAVSTLSPLAAPSGIVPRASSRPIQPWVIQSWVLPVWSFGVLIFSLRMVWGCAQVATLRRRGHPAEDAVLSIVATLSRRLRLTRRTRVLISAWTGGPSLVGWLRPVILVPASAIAGLTPQQLEAVLAHELAHVRRHDYLVNWIQMLVETMLFYHPAVWWVSSRIRHERELCCDDLAVSACDGPLCYARALTTLEKMRAAVPAPVLGSTGGALLYRIQRIMGARMDGTAGQYGPSRASGIVAMSLALASLVLTMNWAQGQSQPRPDYLAQGDVLMRTGANELGLQKYRAGVEQDLTRKAIYQKRCIEVLMRMGKRTEAFEVNAQLLQEHPDDTDALGLYAVELLDRGNASAAIALLNQVIQRVPDNPVAHLDLARAYVVQRDYDAARSEMREAIRLRPDFNRAKEELAKLDPGASLPEDSSNTLAQLGGTADQPAVRKQYEEALALLQTESERAPERLDLAVALGNAAVRAGKYDLAINAFQKVLDRVGPDSKTRGDLYLRLGETYRRIGEREKAIDALLKAHDSMPGNPAVLSSLASLLDGMGRDVEALKIIAEDEVNRSLRHNLVISFLQTELADAQKRLVSAQLQRDPEAVRQAQRALVETTQKLTAAEQEQQALGRVLERIDVAGISQPPRDLHLPVRIGDTLTAAKIGATITAVQTFDPGLDVQVGLTPNGAAQIVITRPRR